MKCWPWCLPLLIVAAVVALLPGDSVRSAPFDWPQWQGIDRTATSKETGLLKTWPKEGPPLAWKAKELGGGYSTPSISNGGVFGMGYRGKDEVVWALNEKDGKELWSKRIGPATPVSYGEGPRCTPTVDGDLLYAIGVAGDLVCLKVSDGSEVWRKQLVKEFKGQVPSWGYSESPLIDGDRVIVTPGKKEATLVCFNKKDGKLIWKGQVPEGDTVGYSSIIIAKVDGAKQYIQFLGGGVVGFSEDGKFLWRYNKPANGTANCSTPIYHDGHVFAASGYGTGGGLAKLTKDGKAEQVYFTNKMKNHHGGMVLLNGCIYGSDEGLLRCLDFKTGKEKWDARPPGKGSIAYADGRLYYRNEGGRIFLVEATPDKYVEHGRFEQPDRSRHSAWAHPVIANGKLYIADQDVLLCYDVKQKP